MEHKVPQRDWRTASFAAFAEYIQRHPAFADGSYDQLPELMKVLQALFNRTALAAGHMDQADPAKIPPVHVLLGDDGKPDKIRITGAVTSVSLSGDTPGDSILNTYTIHPDFSTTRQMRYEFSNGRTWEDEPVTVHSFMPCSHLDFGVVS
jgi:hypothetical protein